MKVSHLDHLVLTVSDLQVSIDFYCGVLGMELIEFSQGRKALKFGAQKINLHLYQHEYTPHADLPTPGSADLCFIIEDKITHIQKQLSEKDINIIEGPVNRSGANGHLISIYLRDPDNNLIELANEL